MKRAVKKLSNPSKTFKRSQQVEEVGLPTINFSKIIKSYLTKYVTFWSENAQF